MDMTSMTATTTMTTEGMNAWDWASISWALVIAIITLACTWVQKNYARLAESGAAARVLMHVVIGYFGFGMLAFGAFAAATRTLPVPGGLAWEGGVAVIGGLAACVIGGTTLIEHAAHVAAHRREANRLAEVPVTVPVPVTAGSRSST